VILRVHAEDGDKGVPREITYGLVSEGNPFISFFNISETTGEKLLNFQHFVRVVQNGKLRNFEESSFVVDCATFYSESL